MTRFIADVFAKALGRHATAHQDSDHPHFHQGSWGTPVPCFERDCPRPHLDV